MNTEFILFSIFMSFLNPWFAGAPGSLGAKGDRGLTGRPGVGPPGNLSLLSILCLSLFYTPSP